MNMNRLYEILKATTIQLRKGEAVVTKQPGVTEIFAMPHVDEIPAGFVPVDMEFLTIGVNLSEAERHRGDLIEILKTYPDQRLALGPSYIEVGGEIGDQGAAFQLFALGSVLGLWNLITPTSLGFDSDEAREIAGRGYIMITGFDPDGKRPEGTAS
jgi:hypothetical protein